ncbi:MAG: MFS transporter [Verrucomicrobia bacterium]|nr:MAG: MFS transporter [Verrucomicrobiota bacterium]
MQVQPKPTPPANALDDRDAPLPGARGALLLLLLINLFNYIDRYVLAAVVDPLKESLFGHPGATGSSSLDALQEWCSTHLGFKPELALIGMLSMAFMVIYMAGAPLFARLAERRSRWGLIAVGVGLWSLASGASGLAGTFWALLLTRCFVGIGEAAYGPVAPALISDFYPVKIRGRVLAWFYMAIPVGTALGFALGGAVAGSKIGEVGARLLGIHAESWRWAFYMVVLPGLALAAACFFVRDPVQSRRSADIPVRSNVDSLPGTELSKNVAADKNVRAPVRWGDYLVLLRTPSYVLCTLGMTAMTFAIGGIAFWMPYYLKHRPGSAGQVEVIFGGIVCVAGLVATLLGGIAGDKLRARISGSYFLVSGIAMLVGFPFMLAMLRAPFPLIWPLIFATCFCLFFNTGPTNTILANVSSPSLRAGAFALNIFITHAFGDVVSPVIIGLLSDRYDMTVAFRAVSAMFILSGVLWLAGVSFLKNDTERAMA